MESSVVQWLAIETAEGRGVGGREGWRRDEKLIAMIPGEIHLLLQAVLSCVHFCLEDECRMTELKRLYIYITTEGLDV